MHFQIKIGLDKGKYSNSTMNKLYDMPSYIYIYRDWKAEGECNSMKMNNKLYREPKPNLMELMLF